VSVTDLGYDEDAWLEWAGGYLDADTAFVVAGGENDDQEWFRHHLIDVRTGTHLGTNGSADRPLPTRSTTQTHLEQALTRLLTGQPLTSDGDLTISSLCREAGVGRDSYYRSPQQFKDSVVAAFANHEAQQPELVALRDEVTALTRARKEADRDHARTVRDLEATIRLYANQIQVLALRNAELEDLNRQRTAVDHTTTALFNSDR
jgi:hypothetical protein